TGVAGPNTQEGHPAGKVFIGISVKDQAEEAFEFQFAGSRSAVRKRSAKYGCHLLLKMMEK
ncbi:hypothetical protein UZ38_36405, partial [Bacillus amyloliquefaciens]